MPLHMIKLSVGIESIDHLKTVQQRRLAEARRAGLGDHLFHRTRHTPRRGAELLDGGSMYWVIKGMIRVRQRLLGFEATTDAGGRRCHIMLDPALTATDHWPRRPFQGWRYLVEADAPGDLEAGGSADYMPPELVAELRALGLM